MTYLLWLESHIEISGYINADTKALFLCICVRMKEKQWEAYNRISESLTEGFSND